MAGVARVKLKPTLPGSVNSLFATDPYNVSGLSVNDLGGVFADKHGVDLARLDVASRQTVARRNPPTKSGRGGFLGRIKDGDRVGQHSIRINDQYRVCFVWRNGNPFDVEIVDYPAKALAFPGIYNVVRGDRAISADTTIRLGKYVGLPAQLWLNLQNDYDLRLAEARGIGKRIKPRAVDHEIELTGSSHA
jgi:hypothetical protein